MSRRFALVPRLLVVGSAVALIGSAFVAPAQAQPAITTSAKAATPSTFSWVKAVAGPQPGEITVSWKHSGKHTTSYQLETALTKFSKTKKSLPDEGRNDRVFTISRKQRSITLTSAQVTDAGAPLGSGVHLLYRLTAVDTVGTHTAVRRWPKLQAVQPEWGAAATNPGDGATVPKLRVASFNVRTAKATGDKRNWLARRADVAAQIIARQPDVVTLQELGPGRADGKSGSTTGALRQTTSLLDSLATLDAARYKLVRTTPYVPAGTEHGSQGTRILYDTAALKLVSTCAETTGSKKYSSSCSVEMPILSTDAESERRSAAYAEFADRSSGDRFFVVSLHLDDRHDTRSDTVEETYDALRGQQVDAVLTAVAKANTKNLPVIVGGDLNSNQHLVSDAPHDALIGAGFVDSASAPARTNMQYCTYNGFTRTQKASSLGFAARLDGIFVNQGSVQSFENVTQVTDTARPSDHNMVLSTLTLDD